MVVSRYKAQEMRIKISNWRTRASDQMPTELIRDPKKWRCLLCCHVRTGTIFLGIWHMGINILGLAVISALMLHPEVLSGRFDGKNEATKNSAVSNSFDGVNVMDFQQYLPTPLSEVDNKLVAIPDISEKDDIDPEPLAMPVGDDIMTPAIFASLAYTDLAGTKTPTYEDLNVNAGVTLITLCIATLLVYGAMKAKPSFLMPFFCLQVFDFFISSFSTIGFLSYVPELRKSAAQNPNFPMRDDILAMDPQCLSLLVFAVAIGALVVKGYCITVVWACYKYLTLCRAAVNNARFLQCPDVEGQSFVSSSFPTADLPDYATVMNDPRFAKKPLYPVPPPPYSAFADEPEPPVQPVAQPTPAAEPVVETPAAAPQPLVETATENEETVKKP